MSNDGNSGVNCFTADGRGAGVHVPCLLTFFSPAREGEVINRRGRKTGDRFERSPDSLQETFRSRASKASRALEAWPL